MSVPDLYRSSASASFSPPNSLPPSGLPSSLGRKKEGYYVLSVQRIGLRLCNVYRRVLVCFRFLLYYVSSSPFFLSPPPPLHSISSPLFFSVFFLYLVPTRFSHCLFFPLLASFSSLSSLFFLLPLFFTSFYFLYLLLSLPCPPFFSFNFLPPFLYFLFSHFP